MIPSEEDARGFLMGFPGKRDIDIPADTYDRMFSAANGLTQQVWGRSPEPEHMQWLYDNGHTEPDQVKQAFGAMPHPHAPSVTVANYEQYSAAKQMFDQLQGHQNAGQ